MKTWTVEALVDLAIAAQGDATGWASLGDAVEEAGWSHPLVMVLVMTQGGRAIARHSTWANLAMDDSFIRRCNASSDMYKGRSPAWARAVLAALLFGDWSEGKRYPAFGTRSPWALVVRTIRKEQAARAKVTKAQIAARAAERARYEALSGGPVRSFSRTRCTRCDVEGGRRINGMDFVCDACAADLSTRMG